MTKQLDTSMSIPLLDLSAQFASIEDEVRSAIDRVLVSQRFILGPEVEALEREVAEYCQCQHGVGVSSGTDALLVALMAVGIEPGDEVITTPYTFFATAGSIARLGAKPVFVDIDPSTFNIDPHAIEAAITERTRALIPVHLYGQMANMDFIMDLAKERGLFVIEDAAQAIGAEFRGRRAGSMGHLGCLSFFPSKNLGGIGDGGMVIGNDTDLMDRVSLLRNHGYRPKYYNKVIGGNFRLDTIQAAVLRVKLRYLDDWTRARQRNADRYGMLFAQAGLLQGDSAVVLPKGSTLDRHVFNQYVIRHAQRDALREYVTAHNIGCEIYYPVPLHLQECFANLAYAEGDFPHSEVAAKDTLALPIYPELTNDMQEYIVGRITSFIREKWNCEDFDDRGRSPAIY